MSEKFRLTYKLGTSEPAALVPTLHSFDFFPTRIWQAQLEASPAQREAWMGEVHALRAAAPKPAGRTNRQGWNSEDMRVLERPAFADLRAAIRHACRSALTEMGQGQRAYELQSWINLHERGGFNFLHQHEGSLLSGGFYLQVPPGSGALVFRDPRPGVIHSFVKGSMPNGHADIHLAPSAGLLVLFPCWLEHYVEPHTADEPRVMIAFNANLPEADARAPAR
jgi:uncharacterized protein (TIGR02466 family)